jgi:hypothetical protein
MSIGLSIWITIYDRYPLLRKSSAHQIPEHHSSFQDLRVLSLRLPSVLIRDGGTLSAERFANAFFHYIDEHSMYPSLRALVLGVHNTPEVLVRTINRFRRPSHGVPRHCFIKGTQTDALNRKTAVRILIPAYILPHLGPFSDIFDCEPDCN